MCTSTQNCTFLAFTQFSSVIHMTIPLDEKAGPQREPAFSNSLFVKPFDHTRTHTHEYVGHDMTCGSSLQANQIGHIVCGCCHITLMYAFGAASVKCAVCNTVTPVNQSTMTELPNQQGPSTSNSGSGAGSSRPQKSQQTVVIVNPPTLDADGNEVKMQILPCTSHVCAIAVTDSGHAVCRACAFIHLKANVSMC